MIPRPPHVLFSFADAMNPQTSPPQEAPAPVNKRNMPPPAPADERPRRGRNAVVRRPPNETINNDDDSLYNAIRTGKTALGVSILHLNPLIASMHAVFIKLYVFLFSQMLVCMSSLSNCMFPIFTDVSIFANTYAVFITPYMFHISTDASG